MRQKLRSHESLYTSQPGKHAHSLLQKEQSRKMRSPLHKDVSGDLRKPISCLFAGLYADTFQWGFSLFLQIQTRKWTKLKKFNYEARERRVGTVMGPGPPVLATAWFWRPFEERNTRFGYLHARDTRVTQKNAVSKSQDLKSRHLEREFGLIKPKPSPILPTMHIWTRGQCAAPRHSCLTAHDLPVSFPPLCPPAEYIFPALLGHNWHMALSLRYTVWWLDTRTYREMFTTRRVVNTSFPWRL